MHFAAIKAAVEAKRSSRSMRRTICRNDSFERSSQTQMKWKMHKRMLTVFIPFLFYCPLERPQQTQRKMNFPSVHPIRLLDSSSECRLDRIFSLHFWLIVLLSVHIWHFSLRTPMSKIFNFPLRHKPGNAVLSITESEWIKRENIRAKLEAYKVGDIVIDAFPFFDRWTNSVEIVIDQYHISRFLEWHSISWTLKTRLTWREARMLIYDKWNKWNCELFIVFYLDIGGQLHIAQWSVHFKVDCLLFSILSCFFFFFSETQNEHKIKKCLERSHLTALRLWMIHSKKITPIFALHN